jgi:MFS-type transporter involved in bile tolerance (Atg22 family)
MAVSAAFATQAWARLGQVWLLYALAMVQAVLQATAAPAQRTFMPRLVPPAQLTAAIALNTLSSRIVMLAGPAPGHAARGPRCQPGRGLFRSPLRGRRRVPPPP